MSNFNYLLILTGLPASGKSTFAHQFKTLIESKGKFKVKIVDPDKIRNELYSNGFNFEKENEVRQTNIKEIKTALKDNYIVISDDLNYYTSMRHDLKKIANQVKKPFFIIHISTPLEVCLRWNEMRGSPIPNQIIININNKFDQFDKYTWDIPILRVDLAQNEDLKREIENLIKKVEDNLKSNKKEIGNKKILKSYDLEYKEELDNITRKIVGKIIQNKDHYSQKSIIIKLRREFIKKYFNRNLQSSEISEEFIKFIKGRLKLEI